MINIKKLGMKFLLGISIFLGFTVHVFADNCSSKLFSVTIDNKLSVKDVIDNLADTCALTVVVKDDIAKLKMDKKLYYVKLKNSTLKGFLNTILRDNDLSYTLQGNKLKISYLITRTFRVHYIAGGRTGKSTATVTIANGESSAGSAGATSSGGGTTGGGGSTSGTDISIESKNEFKFWEEVESSVQRILIGAGDGSIHYTRNGDTWTGPDGKVWEYNPLAPIINPEAGMITVTGTDRQIRRVERYINIATAQMNAQVLIDVRIISVSFDDSTTSGVDWSQLYKLQNVTIDSLMMAQKNVSAYTFDAESHAFTEIGFAVDTEPRNAQVVNISGSTEVKDVVKFLSTQGDVKSISSPRVMTLNNQPALISVGKELFYKIQSASTAGGSGGAVAAQGDTVSSVFSGILLDITPEIDTNGYITLKINPSISDALDDTAPGVTRTIPPDLIRRQIASVIKVKDGEHAILGGLIASKTGFENNKVPLLGDMPLIGDLFKREEKINKVEELVLIITPHIIKNSKSISLKDLGYDGINEE